MNDRSREFRLVERELNYAPHKLLLDIAYRNLERGKQKKDGHGLDCLSAITFSAFAFEAFLNVVGKVDLPDWDKSERKNVIDKFTIICAHYGIEIESEKNDFQTLCQLSKWRDSVVHAKPDSEVLSKKCGELECEKLLYKTSEGRFDELMSIKQAQRVFDVVDDVVYRITLLVPPRKKGKVMGINYGSVLSFNAE